MTSTGLIPSLMIFTLVAALIFGIVMLLRFLRNRGNRHPMRGQRERSVDEIRDEAGNRSR